MFGIGYTLWSRILQMNGLSSVTTDIYSNCNRYNETYNHVDDNQSISFFIQTPSLATGQMVWICQVYIGTIHDCDMACDRFSFAGFFVCGGNTPVTNKFPSQTGSYA